MIFGVEINKLEISCMPLDNLKQTEQNFITLFMVIEVSLIP